MSCAAPGGQGPAISCLAHVGRGVQGVGQSSQAQSARELVSHPVGSGSARAGPGQGICVSMLSPVLSCLHLDERVPVIAGSWGPGRVRHVNWAGLPGLGLWDGYSGHGSGASCHLGGADGGRTFGMAQCQAHGGLVGPYRPYYQARHTG